VTERSKEMNMSVYFIGDTVTLLGSRDGVVGTESRLRAGHLKNHCSIPGRAKSYVFLQSVQTGYWAFLASYSMPNGNPFPGVKAAAA